MATRKKKKKLKAKAKSAPRSYSARTLKLLWGRSAGRCSMPTCRVEVIVDQTSYDPIVVIGDIAHVVAAAGLGPRANTKLKPAARDEYDNLMVLCKNCHTRVDRQPGTYTVAKLLDIKCAHEAWVRASLPERGQSRTGWKCLMFQGDQPLDTQTIAAALAPDYPEGAIKKFSTPSDPADWGAVNTEIVRLVQKLLKGGADVFETRIAVFSIAPVSACISLGYHFTSRPNIKVFQHDRDGKTWQWPSNSSSLSDDLLVHESFGAATNDDVTFIFHLSATVAEQDLLDANIPTRSRVDFRIPTATVSWLKHPDQISRAVVKIREAMEHAKSRVPHAKRWHVAYAGPAPLAVALGQTINPTMFPAVQLYEFRSHSNPRYQPSISLSGPA